MRVLVRWVLLILRRGEAASVEIPEYLAFVPERHLVGFPVS